MSNIAQDESKQNKNTRQMIICFHCFFYEIHCRITSCTPIYKDGDTGSVTNYRGISLLSVVGKCQEGIIHTVIYMTRCFNIISMIPIMAF